MSLPVSTSPGKKKISRTDCYQSLLIIDLIAWMPG